MPDVRYMGWDINSDGGPDAKWIARREYADGGHKLRADTLRGVMSLIREYRP